MTHLSLQQRAALVDPRLLTVIHKRERMVQEMQQLVIDLKTQAASTVRPPHGTPAQNIIADTNRRLQEVRKDLLEQWIKLWNDQRDPWDAPVYARYDPTTLAVVALNRWSPPESWCPRAEDAVAILSHGFVANEQLFNDMVNDALQNVMYMHI